MLRIAADTGKYEAENWRVRKDGSRFWASVVITVLRDEGGATTYSRAGPFELDTFELARDDPDPNFRRVAGQSLSSLPGADPTHFPDIE